MNTSTTHANLEFSTDPYWWEDYSPPDARPVDGLPKSVDVVVVGAGYTGVSCARTLAESGLSVLVLDAGGLGSGASTRSGGQVTGGVNIEKAASRANADAPDKDQQTAAAMMRECAHGMTHLEHLIDRYKIECGYHRTGRFTGCWTPKHYDEWCGKLDALNAITDAGAFMVPPERMSEEIGSNRYFGGLVISRAGHLQPALLYSGLLQAARSHGAQIYGMTEVIEVAKEQNGRFRVTTRQACIQADQVVIATNGYPSSFVGRLRQQVIPVTSHMIATEELSDELAHSLIPTNRAVAETRRVLNHYRLSPDGRRLLFGGRARFVSTSAKTTARLLQRVMVDRFPQLKQVGITHSWEGNVAMTFDFLPHIGEHNGMHYAMGCNGSGVAMMTYLGHRIGQKIISDAEAELSAFDTGTMPEHPLYFGSPWFLSLIGSWYQWLDSMDKRRAHKGRSK